MEGNCYWQTRGTRQTYAIDNDHVEEETQGKGNSVGRRSGTYQILEVRVAGHGPRTPVAGCNEKLSKRREEERRIACLRSADSFLSSFSPARTFIFRKSAKGVGFTVRSNAVSAVSGTCRPCKPDGSRESCLALLLVVIFFLFYVLKLYAFFVFKRLAGLKRTLGETNAKTNEQR